MIATNETPATGERANLSRPARAKSLLAQIVKALEPLQLNCQPPKDSAALRSYAEVLLFDDPELSPDLIRKAAMRYLRQSEENWFPPAGLLLKIAKELADGELPEWQQTWHRVMDACRMWDQYDTKKAIAARQHIGETLYEFVRMLGGFIALTSVDSDTLSVLQSNFRNAFTAERKRAERNRALPDSLRPVPAKLETPQSSIQNIEVLERGDSDA